MSEKKEGDFKKARMEGETEGSQGTSGEEIKVEGGETTLRSRGGFRSGVELRTIPADCDIVRAPSNAPGRRVEIWTNFVQLSSVKDRLIYQYRVDFEPNIESVKLRGTLFKQATASTLSTNAVFDGESDARSGYKTNEEVTTFVLDHPTEPGSRITLTIKRVGTISWGSFEMLRVYNMNMKKLLRKLGFFSVSQSGAYVHEALKTDINESIMMIGGFITAANVHEHGSILMNFEPVHKLVQKSTVYDIMNQIRQRKPSNLQEEIKSKLTGKLVVTRHNKKVYRIEDVNFAKSPEDTFFNRKAERDMTYIEYYQTQHNIPIRETRQPLLLVVDNNRRRAEREGEDRGTDIYLVPEHCNIAGLTDEQRTDNTVKSQLLKESQINPKERVARLGVFLSKLHENQEVSELLSGWGYSYNKDPVKIPGMRVLNMETVGLASVRGRPADQWLQIDSKTADFDRVLQRDKIAVVPGISKMYIITPRSERRAGSILQLLKSGFDKIGLIVEPQNVEHITLDGDNAHSYVQAIKNLSDDTTVAIVVIPHKQDTDKYNAVKKLASVERGLITQVVTSRLLLGDERRASGAAVKIAIQVAAKIGGEPWRINVPTSGTMICGYDTYHDTAKRGRSFGAFVAAMNKAYSRWYSKADSHDRLDELSSHLACNLDLSLKQYRKVNGTYPERVYIYRDGVGDGQLAEVFNIEVKQIQKAINECDENIKLTFIVVNKRVGARFYMKEANTLLNPTPGTVIDDVVTRQERYDFYLISQSTRNGTVAPTYYNILHDESGFTPGQHQSIAFKMCFLYYNWSGTVRVPAPCQYAHKLAYLCGENLHMEPNTRLDDRLHFL